MGVSDKTLPVKRRVNDIRIFRNAKSVYAVEPLIAIVADGSDDEYVRVVACEALGWYNQSIQRDKIISSLESINVEDVPQQLALEIEKTIKRLQWK